MVCDLCRVSVPGSLMLFGEHAVLNKKLALVCAVDKRINAELIPRTDDKILLDSAFCDKMNFCLNELDDCNILSFNKWRFVLASIKELRSKIKIGFNLKITSDYECAIGLGSSAAVTVATLACLYYWIHKTPQNPLQLFNVAKRVIVDVQGVGSGADAAASIFGGVVAYKMSPCRISKIASTLPITVVYSGSKTATCEVIAKVSYHHKKFKRIFYKLYDAMDECSYEAKRSIKSGNLERLGELMNIHQGLQDSLGVNNEALSKIVFSLRKEPNIFGAKISGSGLGDCVIGLGKTANDFFINNMDEKTCINQIKLNVINEGILYI